MVVSNFSERLCSVMLGIAQNYTQFLTVGYLIIDMLLVRKNFIKNC